MAHTLATDLVNLSHHAYCLVGGDAAREELLAILGKKHKIAAKGNADFFDRKYENFTIDDARDVKSLAETKPVDSSGKKIFVLTMTGMSVEAQNALLKLLEEPAEYAHFFLIIPSAHLLLPTLRSRVRFIGDSARSEAPEETLQAAKKFIASPVKERLETVKAMMEDISKEKKTKEDAIDFLNVVEESIQKGGVKKNREALESILLAGKYARDRAPSMKMLLEYVALNLS